MADIKIKHNETAGDFSRETNVEVMGVEYGADELTKAILNTFGRARTNSAEVNITTPDAQDAPEEKPEDGANYYNMRAIQHQHITPDIIRAAVNEENLDGLLHPFDEIDIPLDTGGTVTVVCGFVEPEWARFVFKDCWDEAVMNEENTNKGGYYKSKGRKHVLEDIWPHIAQEWKEIIRPRNITENIDGECVVYRDPLWLPSATDVFGLSEDGYWKDIDDSFQLPIFEKERDRVKECGDEGTYPYWLRSVYASGTNSFRYVGTSGSSTDDYAYYSHGFAPGFDI